MSTAPVPMMLFFKAWLAVILLLILQCLIQTDHRVVKMMMTAALWMERLMAVHGTASREVRPMAGGSMSWVVISSLSFHSGNLFPQTGIPQGYPQFLVWLRVDQRLITHHSASTKSHKAHHDSYSNIPLLLLCLKYFLIQGSGHCKCNSSAVGEQLLCYHDEGLS